MQLALLTSVILLLVMVAAVLFALGRRHKRLRQRFETILGAIADAVITVDDHLRIRYLNPAARTLLGVKDAEAGNLLIGEALLERFPLFDSRGEQPLSDEVVRTVDATGGHSVCCEEQMVLRVPGQIERTVRITSASIPQLDSVRDQRVLVLHDITRQRLLNDQLVFQARHDALTGLLNRREFEHRLGSLLENTRRSERTHALLMIDLDHFKVVNDTCGHHAGDELLRQLTALMKARVRRSDVLARLGGDEFAIILHDCALETAVELGENLRRWISKFQYHDCDRSYSVGASIGLVAIDRDSDGLKEMLHYADVACYAAKDSGRGRVHVYEPDDEQVVRRSGDMGWASRVSEAIANDGFEFCVQELRSLDGVNRPRHLELLLRLVDENEPSGFVEPRRFLAAVERYHLALELDRWVVRHALAQVRELFGHDLGLLSINVTADAVSDQGFLDFALEQMRFQRVNPEMICWELSERTAVGQLQQATHFINVMREEGCRIALDDFGGSVSAFAYLKLMQVDYIKLAPDLITEIDDPISRATLQSVLNVARMTGVQAVAEGVEEMPVLERVKAMGAPLAQGYVLHRPQRLADYLAAASASAAGVSPGAEGLQSP